MRKAFKASRLIGLLALMAGFMAISASAAQAATTWLNAGAEVTGTTKVPVNAKTDLKEGSLKEGILLTKVGLSKIEILCTEIKFVNANLEKEGTGTGKIHFTSPTGCITKQGGATQSKCQPNSPGATGGLIETTALHGVLRLHTLEGGSKDELFELSPEAGKPFVDLSLGTGECAIGNLIEITGVFFLKDIQGEGLVDKVEHLFGEGPLSALLFGGNPATIDGTANGFLPSGNTFAGHV